MLDMKANKKLIQQHIKEGTGKSVTLKDIHNMAKKRHGGLQELIEEMENRPGDCYSMYALVNTSYACKIK